VISTNLDSRTGRTLDTDAIDETSVHRHATLFDPTPPSRPIGFGEKPRQPMT
jgi:hypothetical protein